MKGAVNSDANHSCNLVTQWGFFLVFQLIILRNNRNIFKDELGLKERHS